MVFEKLQLKDAFLFYCFCQYQNVKVTEENWQNVLINIKFCQYFTNILWKNLHTTIILQNFGLKPYQCVPIAKHMNRNLTHHANLHICIIKELINKSWNSCKCTCKCLQVNVNVNEQSIMHCWDQRSCRGQPGSIRGHIARGLIRWIACLLLKAFIWMTYEALGVIFVSPEHVQKETICDHSFCT